MKKYLFSILIAVVLILGGTLTVNTALAKDMSIREFVNLLILIGVIPPERISAVNAWVASLSIVTSTPNVSHTTSGFGGSSGSGSVSNSNTSSVSSIISLPMRNEPVKSQQDITINTIISNPNSSDLLFSIVDLGKWIDSRQQGSYYAGLPNVIKSDDGKLNMFYCSSGEPYNSSYAPDWRNTAKYATDKIRYQSSVDNGKTWSNSSVVIEAYQENNQAVLVQGACANSTLYFQGKYYLYFESYTPVSKLLAIHVARSSNPQGPYEIWTNDGWKQSPTKSIWKPVLVSNMSSINGGDEYAKNNFEKQGQDNPYNLFYGVGIARATQKDGKIYLYYVDTTFYSIYKDNQGNIQKTDIGNNPTKQIPYQLVAISSNPTSFNNNIENRLKTSDGSDMWNQFQVKYSPAEHVFYGFYLDGSLGSNNLVYRKSSDGVTWSLATKIPSLPSSYSILDNNNGFNNTLWTSSYVGLSGDKLGQLNLSDIYIALTKRYNLLNGPVGWLDTPDFKWYYGGTDIYGLKLSTSTSTPPTPTVCTSFTYSNWGTCTNNSQTRIVTNSSPSNCTGGSPVLTQNCTVAPVVVYPVCGSSANISSASLPNLNLCSVGSLANDKGETTDGTNRWYWGCVGQNTGWDKDIAWCFAPKIVVQPSTTTVYPVCDTVKNTCSVGSLGENGTTGDGTNRWYWACVGQNTGWDKDTAWCFANK